MDGVCVHCGECTTVGALHGVCSVAAGAAGVGVAGAIAVGSLTAWVAGADVDAGGATIPNVVCIWFDSIWMMFSNVGMSTYVLSTTNDSDQVGAMISFADDGGRKPQVPGVTEDRYCLASKEWRFLVTASLFVVLCTLNGMLVEVVTFSIGMWVSVPDPLWHSGT